MRKFVRYLMVCAGGLALSVGLAAAASGIAAAQTFGAHSDSGGHGSGGAAAMTRPEASSAFNFSGCWDGTGSEGDLYDEWVGDGIGWIGIIQKGSKIKTGKKASYYEFVWQNGDYAYGEFKSGKADSVGFQVIADAGGSCRVSMVGSPDGDAIYGVYGFYGCGSFDEHVGFFDFAADNSGCADIIP
jgi:hypothetical protein